MPVKVGIWIPPLSKTSGILKEAKGLDSQLVGGASTFSALQLDPTQTVFDRMKAVLKTALHCIAHILPSHDKPF